MSETKTPRLYTIPLQAAWKVPYKQRAKKAVALIQKFVRRHMKTDEKNVRVGAALNDAVWSRGIKFPPRKVKVQVVPQEIDVKGKKSTKVWVELEGVKLELEKKKKEEKKEKKVEAKVEEERKRGKTADSRLSDDEKKEVSKAEEKKEAPKTDEKKAGSGKEEKN